MAFFSLLAKKLSGFLVCSMSEQIGLSLRGRPILFVTRMITDRTGLHSVLLPLLIPVTRPYSLWKLKKWRVNKKILKTVFCQSKHVSQAWSKSLEKTIIMKFENCEGNSFKTHNSNLFQCIFCVVYNLLLTFWAVILILWKIWTQGAFYKSVKYDRPSGRIP